MIHIEGSFIAPTYMLMQWKVHWGAMNSPKNMYV